MEDRTALHLHDAEVNGRLVDVEIRRGVVARVAAGLRSTGRAEAIDCEGGALLPGLQDHHLHLLSMAAEMSSVKVGPAQVRDAAGLARSLRSAARLVVDGEWVRATGYHESVAGELDRWVLDRMVPEVPLRVQHRSGAMWVLNSAAAVAISLDEALIEGVDRDASGTATGRLVRADEWLRCRIDAIRGPRTGVDLARVGALLASYGVTGVTDATPFDELGGFELLAASATTGDLPQRVVVTGSAILAESGVPPPLEQGPVKLVVSDHALGPIDELVASTKRAHHAGRAVAVHCVTNAATVLALTALRQAGARPGDRIEHGSVITHETMAIIAELGCTVVTQPSFVYERGDDYLAEVEAADRPHLYRCASLARAGIAVAGGTDAPFADPDPWLAIRAAVDRRTRSGALVGPDERITATEAVGLFSSPIDRPGGPPMRIEPGAAADLCLLRLPLADALETPSSDNVKMTFRQGSPIYER